MTERAKKADFPVGQVRRYLEPGPVVLVSSWHGGQANVMTLGWHTVLEFSPSLVGCLISSASHSFGLIRASGECVINLPTLALADTVAKVGSSSGATMDKFAAFGLTPGKASQVAAPLIEECHASFECRLYDDVLVARYNFFIFEVVKAHVTPVPAHPQTIHYTGDGVFMVAGKTISRRSLFDPGML
jgi:flavin reductase (DIM6/NTAB) family NADH-FMN oxidoreductase RutF